MSAKRKYPVGIQSFEGLRNDGYVYVDKTPLIYQMITMGKSYFLSRPRRFGKSLLITTLAAIFEGRRDLFEAFTTKEGISQPQLFIATTDWDWEPHPVFRFDFSAGDLVTVEQLDTLIDQTLKGYEQKYGITPSVKDANIRMANLMRVSHSLTGKRAVVLVDEYDNFILHALVDSEKVAIARQRFQNLFAPLKSEDEHLRFAFITGISKYSQMGVFSKLNNLANISMVSAYDAICGISQAELTTQLQADIAQMAEHSHLSYDEMLSRLKNRYDGYHFSEAMTDMYNPFSLLNAFNNKELSDYWFDRGTSGALIKMLAMMPPVDMAENDGIVLPDTAFDMPFDSFEDPIPILYQSGYLTIKDFQQIGEMGMFTLGFPNLEVRKGFADCLYRHVNSSQPALKSRNALLLAYNAFYLSNDLAPFIEALRAFFAGMPYQWEKNNRNEHYYHAVLYTLLSAFGADVRVEEPSAKGRSDLTLKMPREIYVMEIKYNHSADEALEQISQKGYADKYLSDGRPVTEVGISFSSEERNIVEWKTVRKGSN